MQNQILLIGFIIWHFFLSFSAASRSNRSRSSSNSNNRDLSNGFFGSSIFGGGHPANFGFSSDLGFGGSFGDRYEGQYLVYQEVFFCSPLIVFLVACNYLTYLCYATKTQVRHPYECPLCKHPMSVSLQIFHVCYPINIMSGVTLYANVLCPLPCNFLSSSTHIQISHVRLARNIPSS